MWKCVKTYQLDVEYNKNPWLAVFVYYVSSTAAAHCSPFDLVQSYWLEMLCCLYGTTSELDLLCAAVFKLHYDELLAKDAEIAKLRAVVQGLSSGR